jgi:hypothetical protein
MSRRCQGGSRPSRLLPDRAALSFTALLRQGRRRWSFTSARIVSASRRTGWCPNPRLNVGAACSFSECAVTRVASMSMTSGRDASMSWSGACTPASDQALERAAARAASIAASAAGRRRPGCPSAGTPSDRRPPGRTPADAPAAGRYRPGSPRPGPTRSPDPAAPCPGRGGSTAAATAPAPHSTRQPAPPWPRSGSAAPHRPRRRPSCPARRLPDGGTARYDSSPERCLLARVDIALDKQHPPRSEAPFVLLRPPWNQAARKPRASVCERR